MKYSITKKIIALGTLISVGLLSMPFGSLAASQASFNNDPQDPATVRVSNYTKHPNSASHWSTSVNADPGDIVSFSVYYHNTSSETAEDVRLWLQEPSGSKSSFTLSGGITASNASTVKRFATVDISSPQTLTYISGSARWYPNQSVTSQTLPSGQSGSEILGSNGLLIGDVGSGWGTQGSVVLRFQVSGAGGNPNNPQLPSVSTLTAANVSQNSATLQGFVNPNGSTDTTRWFEWGTSQSNFTQTSSQISQGTNSSNFSENISGLSPNTVYYYRAVARNSQGTVYGNTQSFTTSGTTNPGNQLPSVTTLSPTNLSQNSATLQGHVNPNNSTDTTRWFEWGTSQSNFTNTTAQISMGSSASNVAQDISGLSTNTTYYYRVVARNSQGTVYGNTHSFTTGGVNNPSQLPTVVTFDATSVGHNSATLQGHVNPNNSTDTTRWFEYYYSGSGTLSTSRISQGTASSNFSEFLGNLLSNTTYFFRAVAQNSMGTVYGSYLSFTTGNNNPVSNIAPFVVTNSATQVGVASAQLNASLIMGTSASTQGWFEWGSTIGLGNQTASRTIGSTGVIAFSDFVGGLVPNTTYFYRGVVQNQFGMGRGVILSFRTSGTTTPPVPDPVVFSNLTIRQEVENLSFQNGTLTSIAATAGNTIQYRIIVTNTGNGLLDAVTVRDALSPFVDFSEISAGGTYNQSAHEVAWTIRNIASGGTATVTVNVVGKTLADNVVAENTARAEVTNLRTRVSNTTIVLINLSPIVLSISADDDEVRRGGNVIYTIRYKNEGKTEVRNTKLRVILPSGVTYDGSGDGWNRNDNVLELDLANIPAKGSGERSYRVNIDRDLNEGETITTTAIMSYTDVFSSAQRDVTAYVTNTVAGNAVNAFGASLLGAIGGGTLLILLVLLNLAAIAYIIYLARRRSAPLL